MSITLFIPTKNEIEAMRVIMPQIDRSWVDQILVVDGSTDGTAEYAESIGCDVVRQREKGLPPRRLGCPEGRMRARRRRKHPLLPRPLPVKHRHPRQPHQLAEQ